MIKGVIDVIEDGVILGRLYEEDMISWFELPVAEVLEDQRVELEEGRYFSVVNDCMLIEKTLCATHDIDMDRTKADRLAADMLLKSLGWNK